MVFRILAKKNDDIFGTCHKLLKHQLWSSLLIQAFHWDLWWSWTNQRKGTTYYI